MSLLPDPLATIAREDPQRPFAVAPNATHTYGAVDRRVAFASGALRATGLGPGDRLALYEPDAAADPEHVLRTIITVIAAWRLRAVVTPLSSRLPPAAIPDYLARLAHPLLVGEGGLDPEQFVGEAEHDMPAPSWRLDAPATIIFTSGSGGEAKAALHTLGNHVWSARGLLDRNPVLRGDRWLLDLPLYHVGGLAIAVRCLLSGATVALPEHGTPLAESVKTLGATHASLVATQLRRALTDRSTAPLAAMRLLLLGGSAIPEDLLQEARQRGLPVAASYGLTEMASTVTAGSPGDAPEVAGASGAVLPHREARLAPDGEILLRGKTRFAGYVAAAGLDQPFDADGWFASGDLGEWVEHDGERLLRIIGRKDGIFISGGENIQPEAIEAVLLRQPGIRQAVVVPVPSEAFGERPLAFVDAEHWEREEWARAVAAALPRFMVPDTFRPWPDSASGDVKPRRAEMARLARE